MQIFCKNGSVIMTNLTGNTEHIATVNCANFVQKWCRFPRKQHRFHTSFLMYNLVSTSCTQNFVHGFTSLGHIIFSCVNVDVQRCTDLAVSGYCLQGLVTCSGRMEIGQITMTQHMRRCTMKVNLLLNPILGGIELGHSIWLLVADYVTSLL